MCPSFVAEQILDCVMYPQNELTLADLKTQVAIYLRTVWPSLYFKLMEWRAASDRRKASKSKWWGGFVFIYCCYYNGTLVIFSNVFTGMISFQVKLICSFSLKSEIIRLPFVFIESWIFYCNILLCLPDTEQYFLMPYSLIGFSMNLRKGLDLECSLRDMIELSPWDKVFQMILYL